jgi:hypothetical protein
MKPCTVEGCGKRRRGEGAKLCFGHYVEKREKRPRQASDLEKVVNRFHASYAVNATTGCWEWTETLSTNKYPQFYIGYGTELNDVFGSNPRIGSHRFSWWLHNGSIDPYSAVHHKCAVRTCVNPAHLQEVSSINNLAEMLERRKYERKISELETALAACTCKADVA